MDRFVINGNGRLKGKLRVSGAKNASLPIMAAVLLGVMSASALAGRPASFSRSTAFRTVASGPRPSYPRYVSPEATCRTSPTCGTWRS